MQYAQIDHMLCVEISIALNVQENLCILWKIHQVAFRGSVIALDSKV